MMLGSRAAVAWLPDSLSDGDAEWQSGADNNHSRTGNGRFCNGLEFGSARNGDEERREKAH